MCGIIGACNATGDICPLLLEGLTRLEYRGYDSAGIAVNTTAGLRVERVAGKIQSLRNRLQTSPLSGHCGIGHTRWATHGLASEQNAHPITTRAVTLVHNGIIENYNELCSELPDIKLRTQTDTEVIGHLLDRHLANGASMTDAMRAIIPRLRGAFALALLFHDQPDVIGFVRQGSPLLIGVTAGGLQMLSSDLSALAGHVRSMTFLPDGSWGVLGRSQPEIHADGGRIKADYVAVAKSGAQTGLGNYRHYLEKEIYEQPEVIATNVSRIWNPQEQKLHLPQAEAIDPATIDTAVLTACGSAYYACMIGAQYLERYARIPCRCEVASELRYRDVVWPEPHRGVLIGVSQSGETMDTLEALLAGRRNGQRLVAIINWAHSAIAREAGWYLETIAGFERSVATTKAFTAQVLLLLLLALSWGDKRGLMAGAGLKQLGHDLTGLARQVSKVLEQRRQFADLAGSIAGRGAVIYLGRGVLYPVALEAALKIKELSYIDAHAYAAGEIKHGPLATVDSGMPVVILAPGGFLLPKLVNAARQVLSRGAGLIILTDNEGSRQFADSGARVVILPAVAEALTPVIYSIAVQLLAYEVALLKNPDSIDQPRNLAKSVTVE